jgi:hypothetical protein
VSSRYFFKLNQTGTVAEYYLQFTSLANRVYGLSNDALIDCFVSGLNADIRREVLIHTPTSLVKAFSLAKVYEEKYASSTKPQKTTTNSYLTNKPFANKIENSTRKFNCYGSTVVMRFRFIGHNYKKTQRKNNKYTRINNYPFT